MDLDMIKFAGEMLLFGGFMMLYGFIGGFLMKARRCPDCRKHKQGRHWT